MKTFVVDTKADIVGHIHCGIIQDSIIKDSIPKYMVTPPKKKKASDLIGFQNYLQQLRANSYHYPLNF